VSRRGAGAQLGFLFPKITFEDLISRWHADDRDKVRQHFGMRSKTAKITTQSFGGFLRTAVCAGSQRVDVSTQTNMEADTSSGSQHDITSLKQAELRRPANAMTWRTSRV